MEISFSIDGKPFGKERPRPNRTGHGVYTPERTKMYEYKVAQSASLAFFDEPLDSDIRVCISAYFGVAKSDSKRKKQAKISGEIRPARTPDADNIAKAVLDGMNGVVYKDDKQVIELKVTKQYAEKPRVDVSVEEI
ncbi:MULTISPECIES: RusA family crossover junction endodeoxyribonuclease [Lactobacillus]|jgi:hypothetical protein|uniref:Endodeoxyribonuclease RusA n=1 Tax=Myoviridae sp. ctk251 TaxID=2826689 RepID=A0A8S5MSH5_9CAUD|nr:MULTISPECIES: RusA family crossover junction endodeoxyribonuclease [Lactobacillus]DAD85277.1 MAG TPA: Endodeoxyribonuclease RusA [Myoviridae sp. ctk251]EEX27748.1 crossover junction endodeoxyribonuclease RusA [Lactobacillus jensenii SJ-7A-US]MCF1778499.1 RusA family crossover junction endodeoxyribonuclease [Lactobacillus jensenii]MCF1797537.1 RusA family crossover junction endodeoxyribonuclease [Lactobacillus mulieris]MCW8071703.1 RusA family crossover junction endodeoxyribonuclease [Lactob